MTIENQQMSITQSCCKHQFKHKFYSNGYRGTSECIKCWLEVPTEQVKELTEDAAGNKN